VSEFGSAYGQAYAIHRAISEVVAKANRSDSPIRLSAIVNRVRPELPAMPLPALVSAIVDAAEDAGVALTTGEANQAGPPDRSNETPGPD
jgi:hypothetical protein